MARHKTPICLVYAKTCYPPPMPTTTRISLPKTRATLGTPECQATLRAELESLPATALPLQSLLTQTAYALDDFKVTILSTEEGTKTARFRIGIFLQGVNPGCNCADDPTPLTEIPEYGEIELVLDKETAEGVVSVV